MTYKPHLALVLLLCPAAAACAQTTTSPAGSSASSAQTPPAQGNGAPAPGTQVPAPATPAANTGRRRSRPFNRTGNTPAPAAGTGAPAANSTVVITGDPTQPGKPSDDHPLLAMAPLPNGLAIPSGTPILVHLQKPADSGHLHNGDTLDATLVQPLAGLAAGTPVKLTVVEAVPAGRMVSYGELSLQVIRIGKYDVLSDIVTALGKEGKKDIPDAAPALGTEAEFAAGQDLSFPAA